MKGAFPGCHPVVNFLFFSLVLVFSFCLMHPLCLGISLAASFLYSIYLKGKAAVKFNFLFLIPLMLVTALINPLFNHEGATIITYFPNGNPLTLESIVYGVAAAAMLASVICWFSCYNAVMTSDKFIYLFGRVIPALSLILSMALRFVPRFKAQFKAVSDAQRCVGRDVSSGGLIVRIRRAATILSIMVTWALENAIETADSMQSRGYGLPGRSAFSIYRFTSRDKKALSALAFLGAYMIIGWAAGGLGFRFFPSIRSAGGGAYAVSLYIAYLALCLMPFIIDLEEELRWKAIRSVA